jgi:hypothetical protein
MLGTTREETMALTARAKFRDAIAGGNAKAPAKAAPDISTSAPRDRLVATAAAPGPPARVLKIGTTQSIEGRPMHSMHLFPTRLGRIASWRRRDRR